MNYQVAPVPLSRNDAMPKTTQQLLHHIGLALQVIGFLMFASLFFTFARRFGDFTDFDRRMQTQAMIGFLSMGIIVAGKLLCRGIARSGGDLDWQSWTKRDQSPLKPFTTIAGGTEEEQKDNGRLPLGIQLGRLPEKIVVVKCRRCGETSGEQANFCQACGEKL
jgi:hypothetical protein